MKITRATERPLADAGDFAFTEPGEWHEVRAVEDAVVLLGFGRPPRGP
jgi:quercetin dioxygenase-like cupin family protein